MQKCKKRRHDNCYNCQRTKYNHDSKHNCGIALKEPFTLEKQIWHCKLYKPFPLSLNDKKLIEEVNNGE